MVVASDLVASIWGVIGRWLPRHANLRNLAIVALFTRWYSYWGDRLVWTLQLSFRDKLPMFERMKLAAWT